MEASRTGNVEAIKVLLDHGADVNRKETLRETTALMWATSEGHPAAIRLLIQHGADVNARTKQDKSPAYGTAGPGAKIPENLQIGGVTPLVFAVREGSLEA